MFLKEVCYAHQAGIYLIKNTVKLFKVTVFCFNIFKNASYSSNDNATELITKLWILVSISFKKLK